MKSLSVFRSESGTVRQRYSYLMITSLLMVIGICCYYFYFLSSKAEALEERNYRILNRIENKLDGRLEVYREIARSQADAITWRSYYESDAETTGSDDTLEATLNETLRQIQRYALDEDAEYFNTGLTVTNVKAEVTDSWEPGVRVAWSDHKDSMLTLHVEQPMYVFETQKMYVVSVDFELPVGVVMRPVFANDNFDSYMVLRGEEIVYESVPSGMLRFEKDTSAKEEQSFLFGSQRSFTAFINEREYKTYSIGFALESEHAWKLLAFKSAEQFTAEQRTIPRAYLFGVFIGLLFLVLSVPFIKSMIMSRTERLGTSDVIFSACSLAITASIIAILMIDGYMNQDLDEHEQSEQLQVLSNDVESQLMSEVSSIVTELHHFCEVTLGPMDEEATDDDEDYDEATYDMPDYEPVAYSDYSDMFLVSEDGFSWYNMVYEGRYFDVSDRAYFRDMMQGHCMTSAGVQAPFYLDAVVSRSEQEFRAIVSTPVPQDLQVYGDVLAAMSVRLKSLTNVQLNPGSGFAIFDAKGDVFFHSDTTLSLNENLPEECDNDPLLLSAINGRTSWLGELSYANHECTMLVRPLAGTPYMIATYAQQAPRDAIHGQVFGSAFLLQILLFVFYVAVICGSLFFVQRASRLRKPLISLSSFIPDTQAGKRYLNALLFNLCHGIIILAVAALLNESLAVIIWFFIAAPYTVLFNTIELSTKSFRKLLQGDRLKIFVVYVVAVLGTNVVLAAFVGWVALLMIVVAQLLMIAVYWLMAKKLKLFDKWKIFNEPAKTNVYRLPYAGLIFVLAIIVCILPVTSFSILAYNKEKEIQVKLAQLSFMQQQQTRQMNSAEAKSPELMLGNYCHAYYNTYQLQQDIQAQPAQRSDLLYDGFCAMMRRYIQDWGSDQNRLKFGADDHRWEWRYRRDDILVLKASMNGGCAATGGTTYLSPLPQFRVPQIAELGWWVAIKFWVLLLFAVAGLAAILYFFVSKLFLHEKYSRTREQNFDRDFLRSTKPGYKAFVTGVPSAGKSSYFAGLTKDEGPVFRIDFVVQSDFEASMLLEDALKPGPGVVIFDHFEHNLLDSDYTGFKLELIEKTVANKDKKVIIISAVQPVVFLNIIDSDGQKTPEANDNDRRYERWSRVLAAFYDFVYPLQGYRDGEEEEIDEEEERKLPAAEQLMRFVRRECDNGIFLKPVGEELIVEIQRRKDLEEKSADDIWTDREDLIIRIQKLVENYYRSIWDNLAIEEQFVLYDMAQDGLVNAKNQDIVEGLIDKGLVKYVKRLRIMNRSFRNFILCVAGPSEIGALEKKVRQSGAWSKLKLPLLLVVCAMLLFIIKSDRSQLFGVFTAITALIPVVVGLFTVFSQFGKKE